MNMVRKYINELTIEEVCDIVNSYEMCMNHNWVTHEGTAYVSHTKMFLDDLYKNCEITFSFELRREYETNMLNEAHRRLALMFVDNVSS